MQEITLYTTTYCPYCTSAKQLLKRLGYAFKEVDLTNDPEQRQRLSAANNGYRTVPMIFIGPRFVGGFTDLDALHKSGELQKLAAL